MKKTMLLLIALSLSALGAVAQSPELSMTKINSRKFYVDGALVKIHEFQKHLAPVPEAAHLFQQGRTLKTLGNVVGFSGFALAAYAVIDDLVDRSKEVHPAADIFDEHKESNTAFYESGVFFVGVSLTVTGILLSTIGGSKMKEGVNVYNSKRQIACNIGPSRQGLGLCVTF